MRKSKVITITADNRDKGRSYLLTEQPPLKTEAWAARALLALGRAGMEISDDAIELGAPALAAVVAAGISAFRRMAFDDAEPLLREMLDCVSFIPDMAKIDPISSAPISRPLFSDDIDEVSTLLRLREEVLELHLGFSVTAALSTWAADLRKPPASATPTSRPRSGRSSGGGSRHSTKSKRSTG